MKRLLAAASMLVSATVGAAAADLPAQPVVEVEAERWRLAITTYLWGAGLQGTTSVGNLPEVDVDLTFADILDNLDFAAFVTTDINYGRWVAFSDLYYVRLTITERAGGRLADRIKLRSETLSWIFAGGYRVVEAERGHLDALVGGRLYSLTNRVSVSGGRLDNRRAELTETWVDPIVGLRGLFQITPSISARASASVGGFGVSSDQNWDLFGGLGWDPLENVSLIVGYRASGVDYSTSGFSYDAVQQGPIIGGSIRF